MPGTRAGTVWRRTNKTGRAYGVQVPQGLLQDDRAHAAGLPYVTSAELSRVGITQAKRTEGACPADHAGRPRRR